MNSDGPQQVISLCEEKNDLRNIADSLQYIYDNPKKFLYSKNSHLELPLPPQESKIITILDGYGRTLYLEEINQELVTTKEYKNIIQNEKKEVRQKVISAIEKFEQEDTDASERYIAPIVFGYLDARKQICQELKSSPFQK